MPEHWAGLSRLKTVLWVLHGGRNGLNITHVLYLWYKVQSLALAERERGRGERERERETAWTENWSNATPVTERYKGKDAVGLLTKMHSIVTKTTIIMMAQT